MSTGLPNDLIFDVPGQSIASPTLRRIACDYLEEHATKWLLISPLDIGSVDLCGLYDAVNPAGIQPGILFVRNF